ncbi:Transposase, Mutator family [Nitrosomonas eutropha]|nr:Transposase, Mutator family [Nitrosomonas eutropha]
MPRDRAGIFEPPIVRKGQTRLTQMDDQILALYAKGMSTRDIVDAFREMYDADVSPTLDAIYPIVYLDCIVLKIRQNNRVINKLMYLALGINREGHKELLGMWLASIISHS